MVVSKSSCNLRRGAASGVEVPTPAMFTQRNPDTPGTSRSITAMRIAISVRERLPSATSVMAIGATISTEKTIIWRI